MSYYIKLTKKESFLDDNGHLVERIKPIVINKKQIKSVENNCNMDGDFIDGTLICFLNGYIEVTESFEDVCTALCIDIKNEVLNGESE